MKSIREEHFFSVNTDPFGDMDGLIFFKIISKKEKTPKCKRRGINISSKKRKRKIDEMSK